VGNYLHFSSIGLILLQFITVGNYSEVQVVTHCDELQVNKANKTEVEVVTHCDELQVNKADRTEVEVVFSSIGRIHL
jgi:hypothetical protein